jgi:hypothetical protein
LSTPDADEIDATLSKLLHALRQPGAPAPDDLDKLLGRFAELTAGENAGGASANRLLKISQVLGVPLFSNGASDPAAAPASTRDLMAAALSLRLLKAFARIEDPGLREGLVRLVERAAKG